MKNLKLSLILIAWISWMALPVIATYATNNQDERSLSQINTPSRSKRQLAREILFELGIGKQYDLYFWNSVDIAYGMGIRTKFSEWLQQTLVRVAGWKYVEAQYVSRLETNFSETELQELLELSKRPLMKKVMHSVIQAYEETGEKRAKLLYRAWDDYNSGKIEIPSSLMR